MDKVIIIPDNHVGVRPTTDTWAILEPYLKSAPFRVVTENDVHASIIYTDSPILGFVPRPELVLEARVISCQVWFDKYMGINDLVIMLDSEDMVKRNIQIRHEYGVTQFYESYVPHLTIAYDIPAYNASYKWFINEMVNLCAGRMNGQILRFSNEYIESTVRGSGMTEQHHIDKQLNT